MNLTVVPVLAHRKRGEAFRKIGNGPIKIGFKGGKREGFLRIGRSRNRTGE